MKTFHWKASKRSIGGSLFSQAIQFAVAASLALLSVGCAAQLRYSTEALHAMAPNAGIIDVCMQLPMVDEPYEVVAAYDEDTRTVVTDRDWAKFTIFAKTEAEFIYRYDPSLPDETTSMLPEPYKRMSCRAEASKENVPLPVKLEPLVISQPIRQALISVLLTDDRLRVAKENTESAFLSGNRFLGQLTTGGYGPRAMYSQEVVDDVGQMLRDALRKGTPTVPNGSNEAVSILDTREMQVVGGLAAGAGIGIVPGGWLVSTALQASPNLPKPTREFSAGQALGEMGTGALQMFIGGGGTIGGIGLSGTGGGAILGVPVCAAGIALVANGATTFLHGATTLVITICKWDDLPKAADAPPLAAVAPKDVAGPPAPPPAGPAPAPAPAPVNPPPAPIQAAPVKPVVAAPVKPGPVKPPPAKPAPPPAKPTDPTVVRIRPSGTTTTERTRLKPGEKPSDTTLIVRTDEAGNVQSMTVEVESAALVPYNKGGGHHTPSKRAFEGAPNYDAKKALAVPQAELEKLNVRHSNITTAQRIKYTDFAKTGRPLTWDAVAQIETDALVAAKMNPDQARATVAKAIQALKDSNVPGPMRIPWGSK